MIDNPFTHLPWLQEYPAVVLYPGICANPDPRIQTPLLNSFQYELHHIDWTLQKANTPTEQYLDDVIPSTVQFHELLY